MLTPDAYVDTIACRVGLVASRSSARRALAQSILKRRPPRQCQRDGADQSHHKKSMGHVTESDRRSIPSNAGRRRVHSPFLMRTERLRRAHPTVLVAAVSIAALSWPVRAIRSIRITEH